MIDGAGLYGRGMTFPPHIGSEGGVAWSDGEMNIREAIHIILLTSQNERIMMPDFGSSLSQFLFEPNTVPTRHQISEQIKIALARWEPRIAVESVNVEPDPTDLQAAIATIAYKLVATQALAQVSLRIMLGS